jgi:hypothetical protein
LTDFYSLFENKKNKNKKTRPGEKQNSRLVIPQPWVGSVIFGTFFASLKLDEFHIVLRQIDVA